MWLWVAAVRITEKNKTGTKWGSLKQIKGKQNRAPQTRLSSYSCSQLKFHSRPGSTSKRIQSLDSRRGDGGLLKPMRGVGDGSVGKVPAVQTDLWVWSLTYIKQTRRRQKPVVFTALGSGDRQIPVRFVRDPASKDNVENNWRKHVRVNMYMHV